MDKLNTALKEAGVPLFGVCAFADIQPLIACRAAYRLPEGANSVIVCLFPYYTGEFGARNLSRYAVPDDYHQVTGGILEKAAFLLQSRYCSEQFVPFVDSSPIREVEAARRAGLGVVGWNGQLIHREYGSYVFIGAIVTTLDLEPGTPLPGTCRRCHRCLDACPTGALKLPQAFDKALCRSYITQKKGDLSPWEQAQVQAGGMVWGCDICTDVCPMNRRVSRTPIAAFYENPQPVFSPQKLEALLQCKAYNWRGSKVLMRNYQLLQGADAQDQE